MKHDHHVKVIDDPDSTHQIAGKDDSSSSDEANVVMIPDDDEEFGA
jgi:hypothetical protein